MLINDDNYFMILEEIKLRIKEAQYKAVLGMNREQILLYWDIGNVIIANTKYGNRFVENLSRDIRLEHPNIKGYSVRNLQYMRKFASFVPDIAKVQTLSALLSWSHNMHLFDKANSLDEYLWYAAQTIENGWSLSVLEYHTEHTTYERQALTDKTTNFNVTLPEPQSGLAIDTLKDPYIFDFINQREGLIENEIRDEMVANIAKTILELGTGFAYYGKNYQLTVSNSDYYLDLLFYNTKLRCYVVIELKRGKFLPEYAGKLNFYLSAVDDILKHENDNPSIGILLCKEKDKITAEYALKDINKPIGVSEYKLSDYVPPELSDTLPSVEDIEKRINIKYKIKE